MIKEIIFSTESNRRIVVSFGEDYDDKVVVDIQEKTIDGELIKSIEEIPLEVWKEMRKLQ